jgi:hypothetical protein
MILRRREAHLMTDLPDYEGLVTTFGAGENDIPRLAVTEALTASATFTVGSSVAIGLFEVIFESNGGFGSMANQLAGSATALEANTFFLPGHTFTGWNTSADGLGVPYANSATYSFSSNIILYAQYSINSYTVTFDANTGTGSMPTETEPYGSDVALTTNDFELANATFNGWNTNADGSGDAYADGSVYSFTSDITLYAQWVFTANPATVSTTSLNWWNQMGPWRDADRAMGLAGNGYPLLTLIDSIGSQYAVTEAYTRDDPTHVGWGQLLDVNVCPPAALPWLAQFAGVSLPIGTTTSQMRALIVGQANSKRGTVSSLVAVLQQFLTGSQRVTVYERDPDPYSFVIVCQASQISGGAGGATAAAALAALLAAKPAGLVMSFVVQSGLSWSEMVDYPASTAGRWADQTDTWASLADDIPVT